MSFTHETTRERIENPNQVLEFLDTSKNTGAFTDVCIKTAKRKFQAHQLMLSCYSLYFRRMFQTQIKGNPSDAVKIEGIEDTVLESLLSFIYTGTMFLDSTNISDLIAASDYLEMDEAKLYCFDFLKQKISTDTCFEALKIAAKYQNYSLLDKNLQFIKDNFEIVSFSTNFKLQSKHMFIDILTDMSLNCFDQRLIFDLVIRWTKHKEARESDFVEIFQCFDLGNLSPIFLMQVVSTETLVTENHICCALVMKELAKRLREGVSNN